MAYHFKNLIFEGGGVKGIAYIGAVEVLQAKRILRKVSRVGGTSAGAINAALLGLNFSLDEMKDILWELDFNTFLDDSWGVVRDTKRLIEEFGWYKGDFFRQWIGGLIKEKTGNSESTFADIDAQKKNKGFKDMYFIGTNLSTHFCEVFSKEHTPRMCIADAVRISMSIPLFFTAKRGLRSDLYVDGGLLANYPIKLFDRDKYVTANALCRDYYEEHNQALVEMGKEISKYVYNKESLGFRLDSAKEIAVFRDHCEPAHQKIDDFFSYARALIETVWEAQQSNHLHDDDWQRTVYIDTLGVKTTEFDLSADKKNQLIESGRKGITDYLDWYDNNASTPINR